LVSFIQQDGESILRSLFQKCSSVYQPVQPQPAELMDHLVKGPIPPSEVAMAGRGLATREALTASVELARLVDRRGFYQYWVAGRK